ncbi:MAG: hypothetical protein R3228_17080, partial [Halioglobus sp.]|nr:hypothetical protein [Halioglobus sp.]
MFSSFAARAVTLSSTSSSRKRRCSSWEIYVMAAQQVVDLYYDPYSFEIDEDPYPYFKRLRDE